MSTTQSVSALLSNFPDQVVNSANLMAGAKQRQMVFEAVYKGKRQEKTVQEIMAVTGLTHIRVLDVGRALGPFVEKVKGGGFRKKSELAPHYKKILALAQNKKKRESVATKVSPKIIAGTVRVVFPKSAAKAKQITVADINSFSKAVPGAPSLKPTREETIKKAFASIVGEGGKFKDWGGEKSDLYTNKFKVAGARRAVAVAFKGKGTRGKLFPAKMGKNGDQVGRLFDEPAEVFLVVYCGQIDSSVVAQMQAFAMAKAMSGQKVYFGVVDAGDLGMIVAGYPEHFKKAARK